MFPGPYPILYQAVKIQTSIIKYTLRGVNCFIIVLSTLDNILIAEIAESSVKKVLGC